MKPRIHKLGVAEISELFPFVGSDRRWVFSHPGPPTVPMATVAHQPCPTWQDAIKACDAWYVQRDMFEAIAARREAQA